MTLVDSNVWLALALSGHDFHALARDWFEQQPDGSVLFCRSTQQSFLRHLTTRAIFEPFGLPPLSNKTAWSTFLSFRGDRRVGWLVEPKDLETHWKKLSSRAHPAPKLWMDAYLAGHAIASRCQFATTDLAFKQFKGLDLVLLVR